MSRRIRLSAAIAAILLLASFAPLAAEEAKAEVKAKPEAATSDNPVVVMMTNHGEITIELFADKAPITVANFLRYTDEKFYDGTVFHRVIPGFMVQGGGFDQAMAKKETHDAIKNEATNGLLNTTGTISMARTSVVDSATAQFFINTVDNRSLDHRSPDPRGYGYAVFGKVISGMKAVKSIEEVQTVARGAHRNIPVKPVIIETVRRK